MKTVIPYLIFLCLVQLQAVAAEFIQTPMTQSQWEVKISKTECELTHDIPNYGAAGFALEGGHPLEFYLTPKLSHFSVIKASLTDRSAAWMHGQDYNSHYEVSLDTNSGPNNAPRLVVSGSIAERMFTALGRGRIPTFAYLRSADNIHHLETRVAVSSVNFVPAYEQFIACRQQLLPFGISDLQDHVLYFDFHSNNPSSQVDHLFDRINRYFKAVGKGNVLIGSEIADAEKAFGKKWFNLRLENIKKRLIQAGVGKNSIKAQHRLPNGFTKKTIRIHLFGSEALRTYNFASKQAGLTIQTKSRLKMLAHYFSEQFYSGTIIINSHTDSSGSKKSNKLLSTKRAEKFKNYLQDQGVTADKIVIRSYGESKPRYSNRGRGGRAKNRRIVVELAA